MPGVEAYERAIRESFSALKGVSDASTLVMRSLPVKDGARLVPVCELHARDAVLIALLTRWREENSFAFPTQFKATPERTALWLRQRLLDVPDRILFLVQDEQKRSIGYLGYTGCLNSLREMEIENVVRGEKHARPGLMGAALESLLHWARKSFSPSAISLRVFSDNDHAIAFYRRLGFKDDRLLPLRRSERDGAVSFSPVEPGDILPPDRQFLRMTWAA